MTNAIISTQQHAIVQQANSDTQLIGLWLHGKSQHTQKAYGEDTAVFLAYVAKPLNMVTLADLQNFSDSLAGSENSRKRTISSVKSLFTFAQKLGYLQFNVAAAIKAPKAKETLAERILTEEQVQAMIALTTKERDKVLLRLLYASAGRISEVCRLVWADVQPNGDSGQVTLFGKGGKTRAVKLSAATWKALQALRKGASNSEPVFVSQKGGGLDEVSAWRIVGKAAKCAGVDGNVSPHWFRHSHASHALERGASVALVRDTLGHSSLAVTSRYTHAKPNDSSALHLAV